MVDCQLCQMTSFVKNANNNTCYILLFIMMFLSWTHAIVLKELYIWQSNRTLSKIVFRITLLRSGKVTLAKKKKIENAQEAFCFARKKSEKS